MWDTAAGEQRNAELTAGFAHPEVSDFPTPPHIDSHEPIPRVNHADFIRGPLDLRGRLHLADSFEALWSLVRPSTPHAKARRALAWYAAGVRSPDPAIKITSFVSAIEAAIVGYVPDTCKTCSQDRYRLTRRVREFLSEDSQGVLADDYKKTIYTLRSRLTHGEHRYDTDRMLFSLHSGVFDDVLPVRLVVGAALMNWLLAGAP